MGVETVSTAVKLPEEMVRRLDAHAERLRKERPGAVLTRSDAIRELLALALGVVERRSQKGAVERE